MHWSHVITLWFALVAVLVVACQPETTQNHMLVVVMIGVPYLYHLAGGTQQGEG